MMGIKFKLTLIFLFLTGYVSSQSNSMVEEICLKYITDVSEIISSQESETEKSYEKNVSKYGAQEYMKRRLNFYEKHLGITIPAVEFRDESYTIRRWNEENFDECILNTIQFSIFYLEDSTPYKEGKGDYLLPLSQSYKFRFENNYFLIVDYYTPRTKAEKEYVNRMIRLFDHMVIPPPR